MPFGSMNMLLILQILHFNFCPLRSFFMRFFAISQPSCNILKYFNGFLKRGSILRYETCFYVKKKNDPKRPCFTKTQKNTIFVCFRVRSTKLKLGLHYYIEQVKSAFELFRTKNKTKIVFKIFFKC